MVLLFFFLCVMVTTWTQDLSVSLLVLLVCVVLLVGIRITQRKPLFLFVLHCLFVVVAVGASVTWREVSYDAKTPSRETVVIGTGEILSRVDTDTYDLMFGGVIYRYQSEFSYEPGAVLRITGSYKPGLPYSLWLQSLTVRSSWAKSKLILQKSLQRALHREFDYPTWMKMKGYYGVIYEQNALRVGFVSGGMRKRIKKTLIQEMVGIRGESRATALSLGMLIGDRSLLEKEDYESFIASGLVHIIAVSGGNIVMLVVFLSVVFFFVPFYVRVMVILCFIVAFSLLVGSDSSVIRATLMGCLVLIALLSGRGVLSMRSLALAAVVMLLYNPYFLLYDIGFVFSFAAILGLAKSGKYARKKEVGRFLFLIQKVRNAYILPSIGASVGVLPFLLFFTGSFNILSIVANVIVLPVVPLIMIGALLTTWIDRRLPWLAGRQSSIVEYVFMVSDMTLRYGQYIVLANQWFMLGVVPLWLWRLLTREVS